MFFLRPDVSFDKWLAVQLVLRVKSEKNSESMCINSFSSWNYCVANDELANDNNYQFCRPYETFLFLAALVNLPSLRTRIMMKTSLFSLCFLVTMATPRLAAQEKFDDLIVDPPVIRLQGPRASFSLLVHGKTSAGQLVDLTHHAKYRSESPQIAAVSAHGVVTGLADGVTAIQVEDHGKLARVKVEVHGSREARVYHFENDIMPVLSRYGCNSAGCHGNAGGQNGFKLSVFGFDPAADYTALVKEARGRRVLHAAPVESLLILKASGQMAHGGGVRIPADSAEYDLLRGWIAAGTPLGDPVASRVIAVRVAPKERLMRMRGQQQLRVIALHADGREIDVTAHARYQVNQEGLASVSAVGLVSVGETPGQVAIMASYMNCVDTFRALVPRSGAIASYPSYPENNFIDGLVIARLKKLNIAPSELCSDVEYLRRVYLDIIGTLPTADEARRFLADKRANKREALVDVLLERPEYADYWALKWADILRADRQILGPKRAYAYYRWIHDSIAQNKPFDQFARELLTAEGPLEETGPANFYKVVQKPGEIASSLSQVLLGVRIGCAECHHHPYDRWSETDYFGMTAFFTPLSLKPSSRGESVQVLGAPVTKHPRTGATIQPHALGTKMPEQPPNGDGPHEPAAQARDRRVVLAEWMTSPDNPYFARNLANRVWAHFLGRGLVEPIDDVRDTNPPSNPELLDALAKILTTPPADAGGSRAFDVKRLIRTITHSRTYQASSKPNATNDKDELNYSRALFRRIDAEVLLDMVSQTTGVAEKFNGTPPGTRALQLWDSKVNHYFLKLYGRPQRATACECERNHEPSVSQVLHLLNAPEIHAKLTHERGNVAKWVRAHKSNADLIEEIYLTYYSRLPDEAERRTALQHMQRGAGDRREAAEDLAWTLMNTLEFVFKH